MSSNWNWDKFWWTFAGGCCAMIFVGMVASVMGWNFFVTLAIALAAFCAISAISLFIMWIIPKFEEWASEEGRKRAEKSEKDYMKGKDKHWAM